MLVTLRKGGIREKEFLVRGERFWLLPTWEHQCTDQTKPAWHGALAASQAEHPADGRIPVRALCEVHAAHALEDPAAVRALAPFHVWTPAYAEERLGWRPTKPLWAIVLRTWATLDATVLEPSEAYGGCRSWVELEQEPSQAGLVPALTDEAFALHAARVEQALGGVAHAL